MSRSFLLGLAVVLVPAGLAGVLLWGGGGGGGDPARTPPRRPAAAAVVTPVPTETPAPASSGQQGRLRTFGMASVVGATQVATLVRAVRRALVRGDLAGPRRVAAALAAGMRRIAAGGHPEVYAPTARRAIATALRPPLRKAGIDPAKVRPPVP